MTLKNKVGKRIKELRVKRKISQEKLSEMAEISQNMLSGIETGNHFCSAETLEKIITSLNVEASELFDFGHQKNKTELLDEINKILSSNPDKLEEIYKIIKAIVN